MTSAESCQTPPGHAHRKAVREGAGVGYAPRVRRAVVCCVLACSIWALTLPAAAQPPHGRVEPCEVSFVQDNTITCEMCRIASCADELRAKGYVKKCHTGFHSEPGEVWCIAKAPPSDPRARVYLLTLIALAAAVGGVLFVRGRRSPGRTPPG